MRKVYDRDMTVDYTQRCESNPFTLHGAVPEYVVIRYGANAKDMNTDTEFFRWRDVNTSYEELSRGGRRTGVESKPQQHFFNKRIEVPHGKPVRREELQGDHHRDGVVAQDARGGNTGTPQTTFPRARAGSSDRVASGYVVGRYDFTEENCPGHIASAEDKMICDRCGIHIIGG